jgi:DNA (cytosine-5)-methyltransferase 1
MTRPLIRSLTPDLETPADRQMLKVLDLFSGIGGFSLGLERAGMRTVALCEIKPYCRKVLAKHWPDVPCYEDVSTLTAWQLRTDGITVDVVCGGFPCQPFSTAARGRSVAEDLWPKMYRIIHAVRPTWVIAENVDKEAIADAAAMLHIGCNYGTYVRRISGADCGADHQRDRWWLVAHADPKGQFRGAIDAEVAKLPELCRGLWGATNYARAVRILARVSRGMDRSRIEALGNAVMPQIVEAIGRAIMSVQYKS